MGVENNIPEGWMETTLGDLVERITKGTTPKIFSSEKNDVNYIKSDALSYSGFLDNGRFVKISNKTNNKLKRSQLKVDDILLSMAGEKLGKTGIIKEQHLPANTNQAVAIITVNKKRVGYKFIWYKLRNKNTVKYFKTIPSQSAQPNINFQEIRSLPINLPTLPEQKGIAKVLTAFDDKIELLQAQNKTLETIAQTIFKEWFGKYQIGDELPEGWKEDSLDNIALEITRGFTTSYVEKSDIINLNQKVNKGKKLDKQHFKYYPDDTIVPSNKFIKKYDILLNSLGQGTLGRVHLYKENTKNVVADQHVSILRFNNDLSYYVYQILASKSGQYRLENEITGSTGMLMLNIGRVRDFKIIVPTKEKLELFKKSLDPIYGKVEINNSQIQSLTKTRDTLLPKLMSGQVRVNNIKNT